ncbi:unnamed protein product [Caenorhabditis sp. 36 PRJEB53466]|nr:unnamed protein product [Caenorhabditis sp. 36 PRJEB53466]
MRTIGLNAFDRSDVAVVSTDGCRFELKPLESEVARELIRLGTISPRSLKKNILVPFSSLTVKYLLDTTLLKSIEEEEEWISLENAMEEICGFAKQYPKIRTARDTICDLMMSTLSDQNCFLLLKKFNQFDCPLHVAKAFVYIKYNLVRMVLIERTVDMEFFRLPPEDLKMLLDADDLNVDKEVQVAEMANKWIAIDFSRREKFRPILMSSVRLQALPEQMAGMLADYDLSRKAPRKTRDVLIIVGGWLHKKGCNRLEWFDPEVKVWRVCQQSLPMPLAYHGSVILDDHLYVFGGSNGTRTRCETWKMSPKTWQWQRCDNMMEPRNYISNSSVAYDGKIYVFGGQNWREITRNMHRSRTGEVYDPMTDRWNPTAPLQDMRSDCAAAVFEDNIYVCGGFNGDVLLSSVEVYNPLNNFFVRLVNLPYPLSGHCLLVYQHQLFIVGGFNGAERQTKVLVWNQAGEWMMHDHELIQGRSTSAVCTYKGNVVVVGGYTNQVESTCETLLYEHGSPVLELPNLLRAKSALRVLVAPNWRDHLERRGSWSGDSELDLDKDSDDDFETNSAVSLGFEPNNPNA